MFAQKSWRSQRYQQLRQQANAGFTLIEMLAVVVIISVLAAIAVPSWGAFVQRQRVSAMTQKVYTAVQEAQRRAKTAKQETAITFRVQNNVPQYAIHPANVPSNTLDPSTWRVVNDEDPTNQDRLFLCTNLLATDTNRLDTNGTACTNPSAANNARSIIFDQNGALPLDSSNASGIAITVATPEGRDLTRPPINITKRCVVITTLLGAVRVDQGNYTLNGSDYVRGCPPQQT